MDKAELLAEFKAQLDLFDKYQTYIDKAQSYADKFNPAVVEKVITDNTQKIREVADVLDPLVADMRGVVEDLEVAREDVQKGVEDARLKLEELELRQMIGEIAEDDFESETGHLKDQIDNADQRIADIDDEIGDFRATLERWTSGRPDLDDEPASASEADDLLGDFEDESGVELEDDVEDDLLGEEAFADEGGRGDDGVHAHQLHMEDDVSAVFAEEEEEVLEADDGGAEEGISFGDDELGELGDDGLVEAEAPADGEGSAVLVLQEGTSDESIFPLGNEVISLGRGRDNSIQVKNDSKVSRYHCKVFNRGGNYFIEDNKSANGTLVDGELITEKRLIGGEEIIIGETLFRFRIQH